MRCRDAIQAAAMTMFVVVVAPPLVALVVTFALVGDHR